MGFFDSVKKGAKSYLDDYKKSSADKKKYRNDVNEAVKQAQREAYKKEAVKQAQLRAKIQAKQKFNPVQQAGGVGGGMSAEARSLIYGSGFGSPAPQKQVIVKRIIQNKTKKKKKKSPQKRYYSPAPASNPQQDALKRLIYDL